MTNELIKTIRHCEHHLQCNPLNNKAIQIVSALKVRGSRNEAKALGIITDNQIIKTSTIF